MGGLSSLDTFGSGGAARQQSLGPATPKDTTFDFVGVRCPAGLRASSSFSSMLCPVKAGLASALQAQFLNTPAKTLSGSAGPFEHAAAKVNLDLEAVGALQQLRQPLLGAIAGKAVLDPRQPAQHRHYMES